MKALLAIESSCDDTAAAVFIDGKCCSNVVSSQKIHALYGGVVPEHASRAHESFILPVVQEALRQANIGLTDLNAIGFTCGPGLPGSLMVGASFAKGLSTALEIPLIGVNHMLAHIHAHFIEQPVPTFPFLCLIVSGGHTQIVRLNSYFDVELVGSTQDDAAGEAFDKTAKLLGLPYPGGPELDKQARTGNPLAFHFPIAKMPGFDFSFSGLKTAVMQFIQKNKALHPNFIQDNMADICASIQHTIVETLMQKVLLASEHFNIKTLALAGGVSANSLLRARFLELSQEKKYTTFIPDFSFCTDNAAMVGQTAWFCMEADLYANEEIVIHPRLSL